MDRKQQQEELIFKLGLLLSPLYEVVNNPDSHNGKDLSRARAKYHATAKAFENAFAEFTRNEAGHDYLAERSLMYSASSQFDEILKVKLHNIAALSQGLAEYAQKMRNAITTIPVPIDGQILSASNPFSCYCTLRNLCATVNKRLILVDRYMDDALFH